MFTSGMVESTKRVLEVVDLSYQTMCILLTYLYAGKVNLNEENCAVSVSVSVSVSAECQ